MSFPRTGAEKPLVHFRIPFSGTEMSKNQPTGTTRHMREGSVLVAMRPNTTKWQMRIKRPKGDW